MRKERVINASVVARPVERARPEGLVGLVLLLAATGSALTVLAGPPDLGHLPALPSWETLEVLARSPNPPLHGMLEVALLVAWLVWGWVAASVTIELALALAEGGPAKGAAWLHRARAIADRVTLPVARRTVAAAMLVQLATRPPLPAFAFATEPSSIVMSATASQEGFATSLAPHLADVADDVEPAQDVIQYLVQRGDTPWSIAARYYGSGEEFDRLIDANLGKQMPDGRIFNRAGLIYPGWVLDIPLPSPVVEEHDGERWYIVQPGDTLSGISDRLLGSEERYHELFELNVGTRVGKDGPELRSPDLIWPRLRLRLPSDGRTPPDAPAQFAPAPTDQGEPSDNSEQAQPATPPAAESPTPAETPIPTAAVAVAPLPPTPAVEVTPEGAVTAPAWPTSTAPAQEEPAAEPSVPTISLAGSGASGMGPAAAAALGAVGLGLAGTRVLRRRRRQREVPDEPSVALDQGFALADPSWILGQRLAGESDAATEIANRLARSYASVLTEAERAEAFGCVELVAVRYGRTSTTCVLSAPPVVRGHLLRHLEGAVAGAFGDVVDFEGLVSHEGDVFIQLDGIDHRRLRLAILDDVSSEQRLWAEPLLVPLALLYDRRTLYANWHAVSHVLIAAPFGQAAETVLVGVAASLVARRPPADLALVTLASPRALPRELVEAPHQLGTVVDTADHEAVRTQIEQLRDELDRRADADNASPVDVVIVVRELTDLRREDWDLIAPLLSEGPRHRVRLLVASERSAALIAAACPLLDEFRTRLVLQTADEDASQALLGAAGAEELGPGGNMLLRLEGRTPVRAHGFRVAPDHLARLVALMARQPGTASPASPDLVADPPVAHDVETCAEVNIAQLDGSESPAVEGEELNTEEPGDVCADCIETVPSSAAVEPMAPLDPLGDQVRDRVTAPIQEQDDAAATGPVDHVAEHPRSDLLRQLDQAPLRLRCFGTRGVWLGERQIWPSSDAVEETGWELIVLLGIHRVAGVQAETLADILWDEETPPDPGAVLRKRRGRLRLEIKRLVPDPGADPLPTDPKGRVYRLDPRVIASDVHRFVELAAWAKSLTRSDAIAAYEEALALYDGDLLDSVAVPTYTWLYDGAALATSLRPEYRRVQEEVRLRLADLYASGSSEEELGRAVDLYTELTGERPDDDRRWISLLRVQGRRGDAMGLAVSVRRLRTALVELGHGDRPETVRVPPNVQRVLDEVEAQTRPSDQSAAG